MFRFRPLIRSGSALAAVTLVATLGTLAVGVGPAQAVTVSNTTALGPAEATCGTGPSDPSVPGAMTPYPSTITVSGQSGTIADLNVTMTGISGWNADVSALLVGPNGQNLVLLSDAGSEAINGVTLTLDDEAASLLGAAGSWGTSPVTARPTDHLEIVILPNQPVDSWPSPAPSPVSSAPAGSATLSSQFDGIDPNGTWSLYVVDDGCGDPSSISGGWSLDFTLNAAASTTTAVASSVNPSTSGQNVTFTATVTSGGPVTTGTVTFTEGATTLASGVSLNGSGQAAFSTSTLAEGNHIITATYSGTGSFATSNGSVDQRVDNPTVGAGNTLCNTGPLALPASGNATPYPSHVFASGFPTSLVSMTVDLKNVTHPFTDDIDVLLVGPSGQNLVLVSDVGESPPNPPNTSDVTVRFDDAAAGQLAQAGPWGSSGASVTSKPVDYDPGGAPDTFPSPAPSLSAATTLATFNGTDPNGTWSLYVVDDAAPDSGTIAGGWCLNFNFDSTPPDVTINQAGGQVDPTSTSPIDFTVVFSEAVSGFDGADVSFATSTVGGTLSAAVTGGPSTYNVAVSGMTTGGVVAVSIPAASAVDGAANPNTASTSTDNTVTWAPPDSTPPDPCASGVVPAGYTLMLGTPGNDNIVGTPGNDFIRAGDGDDFINGNGGSDILCGEGGDDRIFSKKNRTRADKEGDILSGGPGNDILVGSRHGNLIFGGEGNDLVDNLADGDDEIYGQGGNDILMAGGGKDLLDGGDGNDDLGGGAGDDILIGGPGDDGFWAGPGNDACDGGPGTDTEVEAGACESTADIP